MHGVHHTVCCLQLVTGTFFLMPQWVAGAVDNALGAGRRLYFECLLHNDFFKAEFSKGVKEGPLQGPWEEGPLGIVLIPWQVHSLSTMDGSKSFWQQCPFIVKTEE